MNDAIYNIPQTLVRLIRSIGPIHSEIRDDYEYSIHVVTDANDAPAGFLVEQHLLQPSPAAAPGTGLSYKVPAERDPRIESTWIFAENLNGALDYIRRSAST